MLYIAGRLNGKVFISLREYATNVINLENKNILPLTTLETLETIVDKELVNEFKGQLECHWENIEKYKTFSAPLEKAIRKDNKDGNEDIKTISYKKNY